MSNRECVLVIDGDSDTADVLEAVLAPTGIAVNRLHEVDSTRLASVTARPAVIVLDVESSAVESPLDVAWDGVPQVIIGRIPLADSGDDAVYGDTASRRWLAKPFHYAELIKAIHSLIGHEPQ